MSDNLSLLFQLKAQNQASPVIHQVKGDVSKFTKSVGSDFSALQSVTTSAFGKITSSLTNLTGQLPVVGNAIQGLSTELGSMATSTEAAGTEFAAIAGPIGIAVVALAALAVGAFKGVEALVDLAKSTAAVEGKLFDLSQQTGVSVETLAGLEELAKTTGGSIDSISQSLVVFEGNLDAAQDTTSKQAEAFKKLGVETNNTEDALRQTLAAIAKMPEGFQQTNTAAELFGRRGGKQFLAILKEAQGDIDATITKLQGLGLANTENAKQADELNDQLVHLDTALLGLKATVGNQVIPALTDALKDLQKLLIDNKDAVEALGFAAKFTALSLGGQLKIALSLVDLALIDERNQVLLLIEAYQDLKAVSQRFSGRIPKISGNEIPPQSLNNPQELQDLLRKAAETDKAKQGRPFNLQQIFSEQDKAQAAALNAALERQKKLEADILEIKKKTADVDREINAQNKEREQAIHAEIQSLSAFIEAQTRAIHGGYTWMEQADEFILRFENLSGAMDENQQFWLRFKALIIDTNENLEKLPGFIREAAQAMAESGPQFQEGTGSPGLDVLNPLAPAIPDLAPHIDQIGILKNAYEDLASSIGEGIGSIVQNYILMGSTGPQAFRKVLAAALASVSAQAAVQAIYELALGIAALTPWGAAVYGPAPLHFKSAALFGSIALVAGVAGRGVAGGAFSQNASPAGGGGTASTTSTSPKTPTPIDVDRNRMNVQVTLKLSDGLHQVIEDHVVDNWTSNGRIRTVIQSDGQG